MRFTAHSAGFLLRFGSSALSETLGELIEISAAFGCSGPVVAV